MNDLSKQFQDLASGVKSFLVKHRVTLFIVFAAITLSVMLVDISSMSDAEPTTDQVSEAELSVKVITFDEGSIEVIQTLKGQDITIEALFDPNRIDPFSD